MTRLHYLNQHEEGIAADHSEMVKFSSPADGTYELLRSKMKKMGVYGLNVRTEPQGKQYCQ
jgi:hypothetical protein